MTPESATSKVVNRASHDMTTTVPPAGLASVCRRVGQMVEFIVRVIVLQERAMLLFGMNFTRTTTKESDRVNWMQVMTALIIVVA
jgi:hypothetical protein